MRYKFLIVCLLINLNLILSIQLGDENVCSKEVLTITDEEYQDKKRICEHILYTNECDNLEARYKETELFCCEGYTEIDNKCEIKCPQGCVHGDCVSYKLCENCALGYGGDNCNQTCPNGRFGLNCENDCNCILDSDCNKNYKNCICNLNSIENECKEICKCRSKCKIGLMGKNCDLKCPDYKFGDLCLNDCLCNKNGTEFCNNETGECECLKNYYGIHCERYCSGNLKCTSHKNCICEKTIQQSISHLTNELEKVTNQTKINKNNFEKDIDRLKMNKNFIAFFLSCIIVLLFLIILKISFRTKKIKNQLKSISIRYSNDGNDQFNNQIYGANLETNFSKNDSNSDLEKLTDQSKFLEKFDILKEHLFKKKDQNEKNYPNLVIENSDIYSTINDNGKIDK